MQRSKPGTPDASVYYINGYNEHHQLPVIVNGGFTYTYFYETLPSSRRTTFRLDDATAGDDVLACFKDFGKFGGLSVSGHGASSHASLASLNAAGSSGYYIEPNGDLYIRPVATGKSQTLTITWSSSIAWSGFDTDGDSFTDGEEAALAGRDPFDVTDLGAQFELRRRISRSGTSSTTSRAARSPREPLVGPRPGTRNSSTGISVSPLPEIGFVMMRFKAIRQLDGPASSGDEAMRPDFRVCVACGSRLTRGEAPGNSLTLPVGTHSEWNGTITAIRIDPIAGPGDFEIDWIRVSDGDADDDGIADLIEGFADVDGDGLANLDDVESDGDWTSDADEAAEGRDAYDAGDLGFRYSVDGDFEGWTGGGNISGKTVAGGLLSGSSTNNNPNFFNTGFHFTSGAVTDVLVRLKTTSAGNVRLFFGTDTADSFSSARRFIVSSPPAGQWGLVRFPVSTHCRVDGIHHPPAPLSDQ